MTLIIFFYLLNCFLIVRLFSQWSDKQIKGIKNITLSFVEIFILLPLFSSCVLITVIMVILIIYHIVLYKTEKSIKNIFLGRLIQLIILILSSTFLLGILNQDLYFNKIFFDFISMVLRNNILTQNIKVLNVKFFLIYMAGLLITIIELNHIIRSILKSVKAAPVKRKINADTDTDTDTDTDELKRGKIIGAIERVLFFFFVLTGNYTSIGFILAAKGIIRFKELDDKDFAEYVLIGTLLSTSLSIFCAEIIKKIVNVI